MDNPDHSPHNIIHLDPVHLADFLRHFIAQDDLRTTIKDLTENVSPSEPFVTIDANLIVKHKCIHLIRDTALARQVAEKIDDGTLEKRNSFFTHALSPFGGTGLVTSTHAQHKGQREAVAKALFNITPRCYDVMDKEAQKLAERWGAGGGTEDMAEDIRQYFLKSFCRGTLADDISDDQRLEAVADAANFLLKRGLLTEWFPRVTGEEKVLADYVIDLCQRRFETYAADDQKIADPIQGIFYEHPDFRPAEKGQSLSETQRQVYSEVSNLIFASLTPSSPTTHTIYKLAADEVTQTSLRQECNAITLDASPASSKLRALHQYIMDRFQEKPPLAISIPRKNETGTPVVIGPLTIQPGDMVVYDLRHMEEKLAAEHKGFHGGSDMMFSVGETKCPGRFIAPELSARLVQNILKHLNLKAISPPAFGSGITIPGLYGKIACSKLQAPPVS